MVFDQRKCTDKVLILVNWSSEVKLIKQMDNDFWLVDVGRFNGFVHNRYILVG